jgi:hypothetical protein
VRIFTSDLRTVTLSERTVAVRGELGEQECLCQAGVGEIGKVEAPVGAMYTGVRVVSWAGDEDCCVRQPRGELCDEWDVAPDPDIDGGGAVGLVEGGSHGVEGEPAGVDGDRVSRVAGGGPGTRLPLRVLRYRLRTGSGGAGYSPGGEGIERDLQVLEDCTVSLITERRVSRPYGLWGGEPGAPGENWLLPGGNEGKAERLPDKCTIDLSAGDVLRMLTPGGGGWGPPTAG